jgi:phosphoribosyl-ATP pyrophosphohydrolase
VIEADEPDDVAWEAAHVLYHLMVRTSSADVPLERVLREGRDDVRN